MKEYAIRLINGQDLRESIEKICLENNINTAIVLSAVGSVKTVNIRLAKAESYIKVEEDFEIVSLTGTISNGKAHLHISLADEIGNVIGGHLAKGTIINTTCELVLGILEDYTSQRIKDDNTGYDEIVFRKRDK